MKKLNKKLLSAVLSASLTVTSVPFAGAGTVAEGEQAVINTIALPAETSAKTADAPAELP